MLFERRPGSYNDREVRNLGVDQKIWSRARTDNELDSRKCTHSENEQTLPDNVQYAELTRHNCDNTQNPWNTEIWKNLYSSQISIRKS